MQEGHMAMGQISITAIRETAVDFTYPYFMTNIGIVSKKPMPLPKYLAILWPFKPAVWLAMAIALVMSGPTYWMLSKICKKLLSTQPAILITPSHAALQTFQILFVQSKLKRLQSKGLPKMSCQRLFIYKRQV